MDGVVVFGKRLLKKVGPKPVQFGEPFAQETKELGISLFLRAAFDDHRREFGFLAGRELDFHQLVSCLLEVET